MMNHQENFSQLANRLRPNAIRRLSHLINRPGIISFAGGVPSPETFPIAEIAEISARLVREKGSVVLQYGVTRGNAELIGYVIDYLAARSLKAEASEIVLTTGSQQGLDLVARILIDPGDVVLVELPSYIGGTGALNSAGAELIGLPMDDNGLDPEAVQAKVTALRAAGKKVKLLYTIPNFQNPSGITLSVERRAQILEVARQCDLLILEDDPYGELYFDTNKPSPPPIKSLDNEGRVIYFGSFSKVLTPGLRTAWVTATPEIAARIELVKESVDLCSSMLDQAIVAECYRQNLLQGRIDHLRSFYQVRCQAMLNTLETHAPAGTKWTRPTGGLFVWVDLPAEIAATKLLEQAVEQGVAYVPGHPFFVNDARDNTLRLAFSKETPERISEGIVKLTKLLASVIEQPKTNAEKA